MKKSNSLRKSHESGVALISVLCMIFTGSLLVMMTLMISQTGTFSLIPHIEMQHSMYIAEGVSNRVQWLISADRAKNISESQNMFNISRESETEERFLPDGMSHSIDYHGELVSVTIYDTISGIDLSANSYRSSLQNYVSESSDDEELSENISVLSAKIADYIDSDDVVSTDGMEQSDYETAGFSPLPRNGNPEYREELLYIDGIQSVFPIDSNGRFSAVRLIPPSDMTNIDLSGDPSIYTATADDLRRTGNLEDSEIQSIQDAIAESQSSGVQVSELLDADLMIKIRSLPFSDESSGFYSIIIQPDTQNPRPFRRLSCSFEAADVSGPGDSIVRYMEWMFF